MKYGVITAMEVEAATIRREMGDVTVHERAGAKFWQGKLGGNEVVLLVSGVGKVNAAVYAQILIDDYAPDAILLSGIAGSVDPKASHLSMVVAKSFAYHDLWEVIKGGRYYLDRYPTDPALSARLLALAGDAQYGLILTGDQFIADSAVKDALKKTFPDALAVEMEGCAIAQVAYVNKVPFAGIRCISDMADDNADETYDDFESKAAGVSAKILLGVLRS